jgi:hypothetical protein
MKVMFYKLLGPYLFHHTIPSHAKVNALLVGDD